MKNATLYKKSKRNEKNFNKTPQNKTQPTQHRFSKYRLTRGQKGALLMPSLLE